MIHDAELLRRYAEGKSETAFTEFAGRHLSVVYFTALRGTGGNVALAQEVTQSVFGVAARRAHRLMNHPAIIGWLHAATRHVAARALRKELTRKRYEQVAVANAAIVGAPEYDWTRLSPVIDDALDDLNAKDRQAILERFFAGRSFPDIAGGWCISQDAARMRVDRALDKLRVALTRRGISSLPAALAAALATQGGIAAPAGMVAAMSGSAVGTAAAPIGLSTLLGFMTGTKVFVGTGVVVVALAAGNAVFDHHRATANERRIATLTRELATMRDRLAQAEHWKSGAEARATDADRDNALLLSAVAATRANPVVTGRPATNASRSSSRDDLLAQTLEPLFPNGVVATIGDRTITVDEVRREIAPQLRGLQQTSATAGETRQRVYALQNGVIAGLVARQLDIREFHNQTPDEPAKHVPAEIVDAALADRLRQQFNNDQPSLAAYLNARGMTLTQYRQSIEEDIVYSYMREQQRRLSPAKRDQVASP